MTAKFKKKKKRFVFSQIFWVDITFLHSKILVSLDKQMDRIFDLTESITCPWQLLIFQMKNSNKILF